MILGEIEDGNPVGETCRRYGVSEQSVYRWKHRYSSAGGSDGQRVRVLEEENARLRKIVAQQLIDADSLREKLRVRERVRIC
jgi:putative transposase